jgi:hypothetical protein
MPQHRKPKREEKRDPINAFLNDMDEDTRKLFVRLVKRYVDIVPGEATGPKLKELTKDIEDAARKGCTE